MASPKGKTPRKTTASAAARPRKRAPAKRKAAPRRKTSGGGRLRGPLGVGLVAAGLLVVGVLGGWALGLLRDGVVKEKTIAEVPAPGPKPAARPAAAPPPERPETGYSKKELDALERALKAAQDAAEYRDGSVYVPDTPPVITPTRLPLWDPKAIDQRFDPDTPPVAQPKTEGQRRVAETPTAPPPVKPPAVMPPAAVRAPEVAPQLVALPALPAGAPVWLSNAVVPPEIGGRPMIAIVIDDMGVDRRRTGQIIALPGPVTASFLTYAPDLKAQAKAARAAGKELMVHMPMEPDNPTLDAGPGALKTAMQPATVKEHFADGLDSFAGYVGVNNHMGSRFTAQPDSMRPVIEMLRERGLFWLDSRTTGKPAGPALARTLGVPFAERNIFLDHFNNVEGVRAQLVKLEEAARSQGYAVGIGHPKDHTIQALRQWLPTLKAKGFVLVPMSAVVRVRHPEG